MMRATAYDDDDEPITVTIGQWKRYSRRFCYLTVRQTEAYYDGFANVTGYIDADGNETTYSYNAD